MLGLPILEFTTRLIEIAKLPERNRGAQLKGLLEQLKDQPWLVRQLLTMYGKYQVDSDLDHVQLRHAIAAIAAERYRLVHRHWPDSLESLVPRYLAQVPDDPFVVWTNSFSLPATAREPASAYGTLNPAGKFRRGKTAFSTAKTAKIFGCFGSQLLNCKCFMRMSLRCH